MITIRYFASLREQYGKAEDKIDDVDIHTVADVWKKLNQENLPDNVLVAVNQAYATLDALVKPGDEVAFFPPVTGG
ncbi:MAG: molybdopterin converting factor subunit 1 [Thiothrix sp.]|nr:MAG: molybdopterin converting factor subunit 1 [Thiothrix sp.]